MLRKIGLGNLNLKGKLNFLFIVLTTIPITIISIFIIYQVVEYKKDQALRDVKSEVFSIKEKTNLILARINSEINFLSKSHHLNNLIDYDLNTSQKDSVDNEILQFFQNGLYFKIEILDNNAKKISSIYFDSTSKYITPKNKLNKNPLLFYKDIISDMYPGELKLSPSEVKSPINGKIIPSIDCIYPVYSAGDTILRAILIASIPAEQLFNLFTMSYRDSSIKVVLCNGEGYYLFHSTKKNNWNNLLATRKDENLFHDYGNQIADSILKGTTGTIINYSSKIIEYTSIFNINNNDAKRYVLFTEIPSKIVLKPVNDLLVILVFVLIFILVLSIIASIYVSRLFTSPIQKLINGTQIIRSGDLEYKINVDTNDEIQDLASNFNELVVHWKDLRELEAKQRYEEDLAERKKYLENIIANMGHEIRTPMIGIMGFSKLIPQLDSIEDIHEISDSIYQSSKRLMDTLNLIIDISKLESGEYHPFISMIDLYESSFMVVNALEVVAKEKGIVLKINNECCEFNINSDLNAVQSVLTCLIDNAIKFTEKGSISIDLELFERDSAKWGRISITDTGIGIDESKFEDIFMPFRQGSEGLSRSYEGTGLGLALSKKYIEIIDGRIILESKIGVGSKFTIEFPEKEIEQII